MAFWSVSELSGPKLDQSLKDRLNRLAGFIRLQDSEERVRTSAVTCGRGTRKIPALAGILKYERSLL